MTARKQALLKRHRRHKRLVLAVIAVVLLGCLALGPWWSAPLLALLVWLGHEAWFADHLFYSPRDNYSYQFPADTLVLGLHLQHGRLAAVELPPGELTLFLECRLKAGWLGRLLDPQVRLRAGDDADRQDFERGVAGRRYVNLSGYAEALRRGELHLWTRFCRLQGELRLHVFAQPDLRSKRVMVIAPHADDAELAAFGLYSQAREASIVTLTQGEIEAAHYQRLGLDRQAAARLKGRLRTWDSLVTPCGVGYQQSVACSWATTACSCRPCARRRKTPSAPANPAKAMCAVPVATTPCNCPAMSTAPPPGATWWPIW